MNQINFDINIHNENKRVILIDTKEDSSPTSDNLINDDSADKIKTQIANRLDSNIIEKTGTMKNTCSKGEKEFLKEFMEGLNNQDRFKISNITE